MNETAGIRRSRRLRSRRLRGRRAGRASRFVNYRPSLTRRALTLLLRLAMKLTMRLEIVGLNQLPARGPCIIMINHIAFLDPVIVSGAFPRPVVSMAKVEAYEDRLIGPLIRAFDAFPVNRGDIDRSALRTAFDVLDNGLALLIAPEGTRSRTASLGPAHLGLAYVASEAGAPIVPVGISGSDQWKHNIRRLRRTPIRVRLGRPFYLDSGEGRADSKTLKPMTDEAMVQLASILPPEQRGIYAHLDAAGARYVRFAGQADRAGQA